MAQVLRGKMKRELIIELMAFADNVRVAHWQADTRTTTHQVLGKLYDQVSEATDELVEVIMGCEGTIAVPKMTINIVPEASVKELLDDGLRIINELLDGMVQTYAFDVAAADILAGLSKDIFRAKYLLKV